MRRCDGIAIGSLVLASLSFGACTRTWALSGDPDAGAPLDAITSDAGGAGGASGKGGAPAGTGGYGVGGGSAGGGTAGAGGAAAGGAAAGAGGRPAAACPVAQEKIMVERRTTDLTFIVGRNMSMGTKVGDISRTSAVQSALRMLIHDYQSEVNFGYAEFPAIGQASCPNACCVSLNIVRTQPNNLSAIEQALRQCDFNQSCLAQNDARPIAPTLMAPNLWGSNPTHNQTVVLIVDGPPGCPSEDPSQTCQPALDAVSMLRSSSVLFVVALGQDAQNNKCLKSMAERAAFPGGPSGLIGPWEGFQDPVTALTTAIEPILDGAAATACSIELTSKPARTDRVALWINGAEVPFDSSGWNDGWRFEEGSSRRIQVFGRSCQDLRNAKQADVYALFGCAPCGEATTPCPPRM